MARPCDLKSRRGRTHQRGGCSACYLFIGAGQGGKRGVLLRTALPRETPIRAADHDRDVCACSSPALAQPGTWIMSAILLTPF
jgi:hypothetical protein